jgi:hypothetical protein
MSDKQFRFEDVFDPEYLKDVESYVAYYDRYVTAALARSYIVGYNKCQYQDQPELGMLK